MLSKETTIYFYSVIEKRVEHFNAHYHTYEAAELAHALNAIRRLVPPSWFYCTCLNIGEAENCDKKCGE